MPLDPNSIKDTNGKLLASQEVTRSWLAKAAFIGGGFLLLVSLLLPVFSSLKSSDLSVYVSPIVGLLGVVLGFYFGQKS